jgi:hypothetical protein
MGLDTNGIKFLLACHKQGVSLKRTLMVGRQILNLEAHELKENLQGFNLYESDNQVRKILSEKGGYAETMLKMLGCEDIDSLDYSNYEGANILHDMNLPIPDQYKEKYSTVLESGSLEHIFNFPVSFANCMEMTELNGHLLIITPVNNIMGHGFYQFSPEIFYRVLNEKNGFEIEQMLIFEYSPEEKWYAVKDPKFVKQRVELMNSSATYLCVKAKRTEVKPVLLQFPQQSDYEDAWEGRENYYSRLAQDRDAIERQPDNVSPKKLIKRILPAFILDLFRAYKLSKKVKFNPAFYTEVDILNLK